MTMSHDDSTINTVLVIIIIIIIIFFTLGKYNPEGVQKLNENI